MILWCQSGYKNSMLPVSSLLPVGVFSLSLVVTISKGMTADGGSRGGHHTPLVLTNIQLPMIIFFDSLSLSHSQLPLTQEIYRHLPTQEKIQGEYINIFFIRAPDWKECSVGPQTTNVKLQTLFPTHSRLL